MERTLKARAVGSGQTGLVITWPLNGSVIGGTFAQVGSSGVVGRSPSIRWVRITMPSELTSGMPKPPNTAADTRMQKKRKSRERGGFLVVLRSMLMSWLTKPRTGGSSLRTVQRGPRCHHTTKHLTDP